MPAFPSRASRVASYGPREITPVECRKDPAWLARQPRILARMQHFVRERGFAFVLLPDLREAFLHRSGCVPPVLLDELVEQDWITAVVVEEEKGPRLELVQRATAEEIDDVADDIGNRA